MSSDPVTQKIDLPEIGMNCASCVTRIEKGLSNLPGVSEAQVNFAAQRAIII